MPLDNRRLPPLLVNVFGGVAVLASYAAGIAGHAEPSRALWGNVPASVQPLYTLSMLTATLGYFLFAPYVLFRLDPARTRIGGRFGHGLFTNVFALILLPSALWMPITFAYVAAPSPALWLLDRLVLALVGLGALALIAAVALAEPAPSRRGRALALVGTALFAFQTAVLDALVWPAFY